MEDELQNIRKQLAIALRSIQWSYSIFWSTSPSDPWVLEWGEGYYNGDIKTRKTVQAVEFDVNQMGLQRSKQLRELYESLLAGESSPQARRPSASLSPEDLSNTEWYYLVCMSFVFSLGQGLPGRTLESGQPTWLCNAHQVDSREFSRSLLAKSASIQTVVCFPFLGGVIELGTTDLILEDHSVIQYVQASLLAIDCPAPSWRPISVTHQHDSEVFDDEQTPVERYEEVRMLESPDDSSSGFGIVQPVEETEFMVEGVTGELIDDELSNSVYTSMAFSDCIFQNLVNPENHNSLSRIEVVGEIPPREQGIQDQFKDDLHYQNVLVSLFKSTHELILEPCARNRNKESCFVGWKKEGIGSHFKHTSGSSQRLLKKILFEVPRMHGGSSVEHKVGCHGKERPWKPEADELASNHVIAERKRRERVNDKFSALKSLIPSIDKVDKASILDNTIKHLKELKRRVEELETGQDLDESSERRTHKKPPDMSERTSDNYCNNKAGIKRKAGEADNALGHSSTNTNLSISLTEKDVLIELRCPWKECLLLEIIDALSNLRLDTHSFQSSTFDSILSLTIKAKIKGLRVLSAGMIRQVLHKVLMKAG